MLFSFDELQSYLQGNRTFSPVKQANIQTYLAKQSSTNRNILSHPSITTQSPSKTNSSLEDISTDDRNKELEEKFKDLLRKILQIDPEEKLIAKVDLLSFIEGRRNLTKDQQAQLQAYIAKESPTNQETFSKYLTGTTKTPRITTVGIDNDTEHSAANEDSEDIEEDEKSKDMPSLDLELLNRTIAAENGSFTPNDLQAYLQGQSNLTTIQQIQIKDFLVKQPSFNRSVFVTRSTTTRLSTTTKPSDAHIDDDNKDENISIDDLLDKISSTNSEHFNITTGSEEILISKDDLRSYLEGERNLSEVQQAQIKTYLAKQASSDQQIFSKYLTSTSTRKVPSKLEVNKNSESHWAYNDSLQDDTQKIDHSEETFNTDGKLFNYTIESDKMPFTANELNSYLQDQGNISLSQQQKIEDYLAKKKTTSSMAVPTEITPSDNNIDNKQPDEEINLEEIINGLSQVDSYSLNYSNDSEPILISKDDLRSYLRGKGNLSKVQETHIQAYLATQSPSKVTTSVTPHINIESLFRKGRNNSSTNNTQEEEEYSQKLLLSILGNYNRTTDDEIKSFNIDDLRSYMQGQANISLDKQAQIRSYLAEQLASNENILSETTTAPIQIATLLTTEQDVNKVDDTKFQELLNKIPLVGSQYFNFTTDLDEPILISKDDVLSYVQGRSNLSTSQEQQLQHFLSKLSIVDQTLFSNYMASTTQPTKSSTIHITQSQLLPLIIEHFNRTTNTQNISFTFNDLQSYLEGKANLSELQKENIKEYLNQQSSPLQNIISHYAQSTKQPSSTVTSMKINDKELDDLMEKIPLSDSEEILISKDDIRSYLEGDRSNLSKSQEEKIQVYLEKQMSSDKNIFSKYFTTTTDATHSSISDTNIDLSNQRVRNHTLTNDTSTQTYLPELLPMILEHFILSNDTDKKHLFTGDDLKSFLHGHGNLTLSKIKQIKDYLADQSVAIQNISSHYLKGTAESFNSSTPNDKLPEHKQTEEKALSDLLEKLPSIDFEDLTITKDDLQSYLQGQRNLSKVQEYQIEAYLAKQSSSDQNLLSKYISSATTLSTTSTSSVIDKSTHSYKGKSTSGSKDTHSNRSSKKGQITTAGYAKPTTAFEESLFFFDDLRAYLQGRRNLSPAKIAGIQAYLAKQAASNQTLSSSYFTTTPAPTNISSLSTKMSDNDLSKDLELDDLLRKIPLIDSKYYNLSTTSVEVLILKDDLQSYLKGERNLSIIQETQFQVYLSKQPLSDQRLFSNYLTKIKESGGRSTVDMDRKFELNKETNGIITEDKLVEDDSKELLPLDLEYFNQTVGSEGILFTLDDLQLFLQGRGNLTPAQIEQIRAYLAQQKASNRSIFSKYSKSPHGDFVTSDDDAQNDEMNLEEFLKKILIYLKDLNISSDAEKALFSINNIRAYLQGRLNLSKSDETKMQSTLNKYSSLGNSTLNTSNTTLSFAQHSRLWSPFSRSKENSSTSTRSSKSLSEIDKTKTSTTTTTTTTSSWEKSSIDPKLTITSSDITESSSSKLSTAKKTNTFITSEMPRVSSTTAQFDISSLRSDYPQSKSTITSILFDFTKKQTFQQELDQSTPKSSDAHLTSSHFRSSEISTSTTTLSPTITPYSTTLVVPADHHYIQLSLVLTEII
ncbi:hypothetical protein I4U23_018143 [Adineta vaga]|nr:hypothetical protein I4U23_018143 [Adineta vaga]